MSQIVSGLVRELSCVKSWVLVRKDLPEPQRIHSKKGSQPLHKDLSCTVAGPAKREDEGCDLPQITAPHGKVGQQGLREVAIPRETEFNRGTKVP